MFPDHAAFLAPPVPRRIAIVGSGGAGKSTLARSLGPLLDLPVVHLDRVFWKPGWVESDRASFDRLHAEIDAADAWLVDGNFQRTLALRAARAEGIVLLDLPRRTCLLGAVRRVLTTWGRVRPDMAPGCPEKFDAGFLRWLWEFPVHTMPLVRADLAAAQEKGVRVLTLRSRREIAAFLQLAATRRTTP